MPIDGGFSDSSDARSCRDCGDEGGDVVAQPESAIAAAAVVIVITGNGFMGSHSYSLDEAFTIPEFLGLQPLCARFAEPVQKGGNKWPGRFRENRTTGRFRVDSSHPPFATYLS